ATPFTRSFYAKNSSSLHLLILQRSPNVCLGEERVGAA
ncbi:hypothetical protein A343_0264, partial [Porphyromonas gingivalis JCVI SC001]